MGSTEAMRDRDGIWGAGVVLRIEPPAPTRCLCKPNTRTEVALYQASLPIRSGSRASEICLGLVVALQA